MARLPSKVAVVGSGGREHAICWKLAQSPSIENLYAMPGNGGTATASKTTNIDVKADNIEKIVWHCQSNKIEFVIVGPEVPLANGLVDELCKVGITAFGPSSLAAELEASKAFSKEFMTRHGIPTASYATFTELEAAKRYVKDKEASKLVIKASGLAAGKGVVLPGNEEEALKELEEMMANGKFSEAGATVVVEERLVGEELSCLFFTDGYDYVACPPSQDHKRRFDGDLGPNTGGMGAFAPAPVSNPSLMEEIGRRVIEPTLRGMREEGRPFVGCLYAGMMLTKSGPKVLEFNCRMGDPETQVILPLLKSDLAELMWACASRCLACVTPVFSTGSCATVVAVSPGYPGKYPKGMEIFDLDKVDCLMFHAGTKAEDGRIVTSGGRVLAMTSKADSLEEALDKCYENLRIVNFQGMAMRFDIGKKAVEAQVVKERPSAYAAAGVDIDEANAAVRMMKQSVDQTYGPEVLSELGLFGGIFDLAQVIKRYADPVLVASTDGVGTKVMIASALSNFKTVGHDLVNHCTNDILVQGAKPLFFLDYVASSKLDRVHISDLVKGVAEGCKENVCALLGGETAEMPGVYQAGETDLAGTIVGVVDRAHIIDGKKIQAGDVVLVSPSAGPHTNGYSLLRKCFRGLDLNEKRDDLGGQSLAEAMLSPHVSYLNEFERLKAADVEIRGMVHVTGGGLLENPPRILANDLAMELDLSAWEAPHIFEMAQRLGAVGRDEMARVFNMGAGMLWVVSEKQADAALEQLGVRAVKGGKIISKPWRRGEPQTDGDQVILKGNFRYASGKVVSPRTVRIGIVGSTRGSSSQPIIDAIEAGDLDAAITCVVSNDPNAKILERGKKHSLTTWVCPSKGRKKAEFEAELTKILEDCNVDVVLLIGFMKILSNSFVKKWQSRLLNVHPSLLPKFAGGMDLNVHAEILDAKEPVTGCTVHEVSEKLDGGAVVAQKRCRVMPDDTPDSLKARVQALEGAAFIEVLSSWVAREE